MFNVNISLPREKRCNGQSSLMKPLAQQSGFVYNISDLTPVLRKRRTGVISRPGRPAGDAAH